MDSSNTDFLAAPMRRRRGRKTPASPAGPTLTLISATYDPDYSSVTLTFNQEINTDAMVVAAILVDDTQFQGLLMRGITTTLLTANSVTVEMDSIGPSVGAGVSLSVSEGNGIIAVHDSSEWGGVSGVALPFGV